MEMTQEVISKIQKDKGFYRSPELNETLYLHYKGFERINGLSEFVNARCIWLEGNCFADIEGFEGLEESLRQLYLQENMIREIKGLSHLKNLVSINLSNNMITRIQGLSELPQLKTIHLKQNRIKKYEDVEHLLECTALQAVDLTDNLIDDERCVEIFAAMPELLTLYTHKNPFTGKVKPYRKTLLGRCEKLRYLDDRPVFADERREVTAWMSGGTDAEKAERKAIRDEKEAERLKNLEHFLALRDKWTKQREEREERGEVTPHTEYYLRNYTTPTEEDRWFTEERRRNAAMTDQERVKERREIIDSLPGRRPASPKQSAETRPKPPTHADPCAIELPESPQRAVHSP
eukprot:Hpha_TRINITY_DN15606_c1_g11::TRINITY_DN15606_c1_g11_i1::g.100727::m.100727/K19750/DNAAF1, LRRC50, ODA7; dynein assembly factor 1, axonemal